MNGGKGTLCKGYVQVLSRGTGWIEIVILPVVSYEEERRAMWRPRGGWKVELGSTFLFFFVSATVATVRHLVPNRRRGMGPHCTRCCSRLGGSIITSLEGVEK